QRRVALAAADALAGRVTVFNDGRSYVLKIRAELEDPKLAAGIANAYVDTYLDGQREAKYDATRRANAWLTDRIAELKEKVTESERAVQVYSDEHNLSEIKGTTVTSQQLSEV